MDKQNINKKPSNLLSKDNLDLSTLENARIRSWNDLSTRIDTWDKQQMQPQIKPNRFKKFILPFSVGFATTAIAGVFILSGIFIYQNYTKINSNSTSSKNIQAQLADSLQKNTGLTLDDLKFLQQNGIISATNTSNSGINAVYANMNLNSATSNNYTKTLADTNQTISRLSPEIQQKVKTILAKIPKSSDLVIRKYQVTTNLTADQLLQTKYFSGMPTDASSIEKFASNPEIKKYIQEMLDLYSNSVSESWIQGGNNKQITSSNGKIISFNSLITDNFGKAINTTYLGGKYAISSSFQMYDSKDLLQNQTNCYKLDNNICIDEQTINNLIADPDLGFMLQALNPNASSSSSYGLFGNYKYLGTEVVDGQELAVYKSEMPQGATYDSSSQSWTSLNQESNLYTKVYFDMNKMQKIIEQNYINGIMVTQNKLLSYQKIQNGKIDTSELNGIEIKEQPQYTDGIQNELNNKTYKVSEISDKAIVFAPVNMRGIYDFQYYETAKEVQSANLAKDIYMSEDFNPWSKYERLITGFKTQPDPVSQIEAVDINYTLFNYLGTVLKSNMLSVNVFNKTGLNLAENDLKAWGNPKNAKIVPIKVNLDNKNIASGTLITLSKNDPADVSFTQTIYFEYSGKTYELMYSYNGDPKDLEQNNLFPNNSTILNLRTITDADIDRTIVPQDFYTSTFIYIPSKTNYKILTFDIPVSNKVNFSFQKMGQTQDTQGATMDAIYNIGWNSNDLLQRLWGYDGTYNLIFYIHDEVKTIDEMKNISSNNSTALIPGANIETKNVKVVINNQKIDAVVTILNTKTSSDFQLTAFSLKFNYDNKNYEFESDFQMYNLLKDQISNGEIKMKLLQDSEVVQVESSSSNKSI